jgi:Fe-S cluster assembly protein SufD
MATSTVEVNAGTTAPVLLDRSNTLRSFDTALFEVPTGREEEWRFTPMKRLAPLLQDAPGDARVTWTPTLPDGVDWSVLDAGEARERTVAVPLDRTSVLAMAHAGQAPLLRIAENARPDQVVGVGVHVPAGTAHGHLLIEAGTGSESTVVVARTGGGAFGENVSVRVADGARLDLVLFQDWDASAIHSSHLAIEVGRDARVRTITVTLGGGVVRAVQTVRYAGPGGDAEAHGLYFADAGQHLEHRLFIDHGQSHCRSRVAFKGALQGQDAHAVWIGDVLIRASAIGTDTYELNRNLVLSDGTRVDSVPNLEIETGDVAGAGHASATGRFDDEQLFYLQARGIPADQARRLVVRGFFSEVLDLIADEELAADIARRLDAELEGSEA